MGYTRQVTRVPRYPNNNNNSGYPPAPTTQWEFSEKAVALIREYLDRFPQVCQAIERNPNADNFSINELFVDGEIPIISAQSTTPTISVSEVKAVLEEEEAIPLVDESQVEPIPNPDESGVLQTEGPKVPILEDLDLEELEEDEETKLERLEKEDDKKKASFVRAIRTWLKSLDYANQPRVPAGSQSLTNEAIKLVEEEGTRYGTYLEKSKKTKVLSNVEPNLLLRASPSLAPHLFNKDRYFLGDRVAVASDIGPIPFGAQGTLIAIRGEIADVIFDMEFIGGTSLNKW